MLRPSEEGVVDGRDVASGVGMWLVDEGDSKGGVKVLGFGVSGKGVRG